MRCYEKFDPGTERPVKHHVWRGAAPATPGKRHRRGHRRRPGSTRLGQDGGEDGEDERGIQVSPQKTAVIVFSGRRRCGSIRFEVQSE